MSTNPYGRYFISYRRPPARPNGTLEAERLRTSLRDRGLPTWRDVEDLSAEPTEPELVATLQDPNIAGAILLISPEVADSPMIRKVEAHRIFQRHSSGDGFVVEPVLIQLDHTQANEALGAPAGFQDLVDWNLRRVETDELMTDQAEAIARNVLKARIKAIRSGGSDRELQVGVFSRRPPSGDDLALRWDYSAYFHGRRCEAGTYDTIQRAFVDSATAVLDGDDNPRMLTKGYGALPLAVLFGAVFSPLAGFKVACHQSLAGKESRSWSLDLEVEDVKLAVTTKTADPASEDVVIALGISANIERTVAEFLDVGGIRPRALLHVAIKSGSVPTGHELSPGEGLSVVYQTVEELRKLRDDFGLARVRLHLFLACPFAMAVILGQKLNTVSSCCLYEHDPNEVPSYHLVHEFNPSGFVYN